ncbi:unnamed protein product [Didymodactylos carnosus]|uniref:Uncharacterized protein n=1 Tax=Didymodactylos carnosus TaxID=1234261 RepID=A0A815AIL0_9BILA|nr:unnamed protein product [Didymodactylos carnosus]CAF4026963.1 unnamed protein product [Didymodactylos carnosus]
MSTADTNSLSTSLTINYFYSQRQPLYESLATLTKNSQPLNEDSIRSSIELLCQQHLCIPNVSERMAFAQSEQISVLWSRNMHELFDSIVKWSVDYMVTFCVYDRSGEQRHIIDSFRSDAKLNGFQRSTIEMMVVLVMPTFFPFSMILQAENAHSTDVTMFRKCSIDCFDDISNKILAYMLSLNPSFPHYVERDMIDQENSCKVVQTIQEFADTYRRYIPQSFVYKRVYKTYIKCLHSCIATSLASIGNAYKGKREYAGAWEYYSTCLRMQEKCLPSDHAHIARSLNNIAGVRTIHFNRALSNIELGDSLKTSEQVDDLRKIYEKGAAALLTNPDNSEFKQNDQNDDEFILPITDVSPAIATEYLIESNNHSALDASVLFDVVFLGDKTKASRDTFNELRRAVPQSKYFDDEEHCFEHIRLNRTIHSLVLTEKYNIYDILKSLHDETTLRSIYIFASEPRRYQQLSKSYPKVICSLSQKETLLNQVLTDSALYCDELGDKYQCQNNKTMALTLYYFAESLHDMIDNQLKQRIV